MKIGDKVTVMVGIYAGKDALVDVIAEADKSIGVMLLGVIGIQSLTWFKPGEVKLKED